METENGQQSADEDASVLLQVPVWEICRNISKEDGRVSFDHSFITALSSCAHQQIGNMSQKLEMFAKHGRRSEITIDDLKLFFIDMSAMISVIDNAVLKNKSNTNDITESFQSLDASLTAESSIENSSDMSLSSQIEMCGKTYVRKVHPNSRNDTMKEKNIENKDLALKNKKNERKVLQPVKACLEPVTEESEYSEADSCSFEAQRSDITPAVNLKYKMKRKSLGLRERSRINYQTSE